MLTCKEVMEVNRSQLTPQTEPSQDGLLPAEGKLRVNKSKAHFSMSSQMSKEKEVFYEEQLPIMIGRRTPLRSPNISFNNEFELRRLGDEIMPRKRCFSKEVLELSRHQIIMTRSSKVDISMMPPKRVRFDDFNHASGSSSSSQRLLSTSKNSAPLKREGALKHQALKPSRFPVPALLDNSTNSNLNQNVDGINIHSKKPTSTGIVVERKKKGSTPKSHFLVSVQNFPLEMWKENNCDPKMLREIISLSEINAIPVSVIQKGDQLVLKCANAMDADAIRCISPNSQRGIVIFDILKSPFTLTFRLLSGIIRWIVGN